MSACELFYLSVSQSAHILPFRLCLVPLNSSGQSVLQSPYRPPPKACARLGGVQFQETSFVRAICLLRNPAGISAPQLRGTISNRANALVISLIRAEVPSFRESSPRITQTLGQLQIPMQRLKNMLPGTYRVRIADHRLLAYGPASHQVGNQSIGCPIASADHVPCPGAPDSRFAVRKKRLPIGSGRDLSTGFAAGIRIKSAQRFGFIVTGVSFAI